jgi:hypothetical protein
VPARGARLRPGLQRSTPRIPKDVYAHLRIRRRLHRHLCVRLELPESAFIEQTGGSANPLWGSCGDFESGWGGANDYGVYLEALVPTRYECGFMADVFYGGNASSLTTRIDAGMPVMTELGNFGESA